MKVVDDDQDGILVAEAKLEFQNGIQTLVAKFVEVFPVASSHLRDIESYLCQDLEAAEGLLAGIKIPEYFDLENLPGISHFIPESTGSSLKFNMFEVPGLNPFVSGFEDGINPLFDSYQLAGIRFYFLMLVMAYGLQPAVNGMLDLHKRSIIDYFLENKLEIPSRFLIGLTPQQRQYVDIQRVKIEREDKELDDLSTDVMDCIVEKRRVVREAISRRMIGSDPVFVGRAQENFDDRLSAFTDRVADLVVGETGRIETLVETQDLDANMVKVLGIEEFGFLGDIILVV